jgi:hypothetical protein
MFHGLLFSFYLPNKSGKHTREEGERLVHLFTAETFNGGSQRTTESPAGTVRSPASLARFTTKRLGVFPDSRKPGTASMASRIEDKAQHQPHPAQRLESPGNPTGATPPCGFDLSCTFTFSRTPPDSISPSTARATAQASGVPPKVEPCEPGPSAPACCITHPESPPSENLRQIPSPSSPHRARPRHRFLRGRFSSRTSHRSSRRHTALRRTSEADRTRRAAPPPRRKTPGSPY